MIDVEEIEIDDHDYWQDEIDQLRIEEMRKHCPGCPYWDDYYLCTMGSCVYADDYYVAPRVETIHPKLEKISTPIPPNTKVLGILGGIL